MIEVTAIRVLTHSLNGGESLLESRLIGSVPLEAEKVVTKFR